MGREGGICVIGFRGMDGRHCMRAGSHITSAIGVVILLLSRCFCVCFLCRFERLLEPAAAATAVSIAQTKLYDSLAVVKLVT